MSFEISPKLRPELVCRDSGVLPVAIARAGEQAARRYLEFFTVNIRNPNTRLAYYRAVTQFFDWCQARGVALHQVEPMIVATHVEELGWRRSKPTVQQHLAAVRMLFDWLVIGQVVPMNPAASVRGPKYVLKKGKTPVLSADQARALLDSIDTRHVVGLRDRALIGVMVYSFARVSAVVGMKVDDYYQNGKRWWIRLHEKGGKFHEVPVHHNAEAYLDAYLAAAGIAGQPGSPLFRTTAGQSRRLTAAAMGRRDVLRMIKRRCKPVGLPRKICCHTFRGRPASRPISTTAARWNTPRRSPRTNRHGRPSSMTERPTKSRSTRLSGS